MLVVRLVTCDVWCAFKFMHFTSSRNVRNLTCGLIHSLPRYDQGVYKSSCFSVWKNVRDVFSAGVDISSRVFWALKIASAFHLKIPTFALHQHETWPECERSRASRPFWSKVVGGRVWVWGKMVNVKVFLRLWRLNTAGGFCRFAQVLVDKIHGTKVIHRNRRNYAARWLTLVHGKVFWTTHWRPADVLACWCCWCSTGVSLAIVPMKTLSRLQAHGKGKKGGWIRGQISRRDLQAK